MYKENALYAVPGKLKCFVVCVTHCFETKSHWALKGPNIALYSHTT